MNRREQIQEETKADRVVCFSKRFKKENHQSLRGKCTLLVTGGSDPSN